MGAPSNALITIDGLSYNPWTGWFWRKGFRAGGSDCTKGYRRILWKGKRYKEHRLAWYFYTLSWPKNQIDHINQNKEDNCIRNLRDVSQTHNMYNKTKAHINSLSSFLGVSKRNNKFHARLRVGKSLLHLGIYDTPEEAQKVYMNKKQEILKLHANV